MLGRPCVLGWEKGWKPRDKTSPPGPVRLYGLCGQSTWHCLKEALATLKRDFFESENLCLQTWLFMLFLFSIMRFVGVVVWGGCIFLFALSLALCKICTEVNIEREFCKYILAPRADPCLTTRWDGDFHVLKSRLWSISCRRYRIILWFCPPNLTAVPLQAPSHWILRAPKRTRLDFCVSFLQQDGNSQGF